MKKYIVMIEWSGSENIYQILVRTNLMVNKGNCFNGIERTSNKRWQRTFCSEVLVYKVHYAKYSLLLELTLCDIRASLCDRAFEEPSVFQHNHMTWTDTQKTQFQITLHIPYASMVSNIRIMVADTIRLCFWTKTFKRGVWKARDCLGK